jgi:ATP-dependent RNA helicase RhlB
MKFNELELNPQVMGGIDDAGFTKCTEVQEQTLVHSLKAKDVAVQSQTGTGKTAAFLITIFQLLLENEEFKGKKALIIAPTRELAVQIERDGNVIGGKTGLKIGSFYGGVGYGKQESLLNNGVDVMIGTPGRLIDLNKSGKLSFAKVGILVIDEADRLFDMGFYPDITWMLRRMDDPENRVTMLFSATLDQKVRNLAWKYMRNPAEIAVEPEKLTVDLIQQKLYHLGKDEKLPFLLGLLEREQPQNALIFANTKKMVEILAKRLKANGYNCHYIMGDLPQKKRMRIIDDLKQGKLQFLVATDVAARGLHVDDLDMVINFDLPEDCENYVHRIGRTARAGKTGKAVSFACERYVYGLEPIEKLINMKIPVESVSDTMLSEDKSADQFIQLERHGERQGHRGSRKREPRRKSSPIRSKGKSRHPAGGNQSPEKQKTQPQTRKESGGRGRPQQKPAAKKGAPKRKKDINVNQALGKKPDSTSSMEDRLAYYRKKYGENFTVDQERTPAEKQGKKKKPGLLKRLFGSSEKK